MTPLRIACIGNGKMGRSVAALAVERGHVVVATLDAAENQRGSGVRRDLLGNPDVAIEFTLPDAAVDNAVACLEQGIPVVVGTTGWYDELPRVRAAVEASNGSLFFAPNFSPGVAAFAELAAVAARLMARMAEFDTHIVETHHAAKKDAPSGTARLLQDAMRESLGRTAATTSVRVGSVPGTHEIVCDAPFEQIRLVHEARDRRVFAAGAVRAAEWLVGRRGIFTMRDMLQLTGGR